MQRTTDSDATWHAPSNASADANARQALEEQKDLARRLEERLHHSVAAQSQVRAFPLGSSVPMHCRRCALEAERRWQEHQQQRTELEARLLALQLKHEATDRQRLLLLQEVDAVRSYLAEHSTAQRRMIGDGTSHQPMLGLAQLAQEAFHALQQELAASRTQLHQALATVSGLEESLHLKGMELADLRERTQTALEAEAHGSLALSRRTVDLNNLLEERIGHIHVRNARRATRCNTQ